MRSTLEQLIPQRLGQSGHRLNVLPYGNPTNTPNLGGIAEVKLVQLAPERAVLGGSDLPQLLIRVRGRATLEERRAKQFVVTLSSAIELVHVQADAPWVGLLPQDGIPFLCLAVTGIKTERAITENRLDQEPTYLELKTRSGEVIGDEYAFGQLPTGIACSRQYLIAESSPYSRQADEVIFIDEAGPNCHLQLGEEQIKLESGIFLHIPSRTARRWLVGMDEWIKIWSVRGGINLASPDLKYLE